MNRDFSEIMSQRSDNELSDILTIKRDEYQLEAIEAAQNEFNRRKLDLNSIVNNYQVSDSNSSSPATDNEKMTLIQKVLLFLFPGYGPILFRLFCVHVLNNEIWSGLALPLVIIAQIMIYRNLKNNNREKMAIDFKKWVKYSWVFFGSLMVIIFALVIILQANPRH